jgi:hypothetical protein
MDAERFDAFARILATRAPRRTALRGGAGVAAALLGIVGLRSSTEAANSGLGRHTVVRRYALSGKASDAGNALKKLLPSIEKAPGFIDYSVVDAGGGQLMTVLVFTDKASAAAAAQLEKDWIAQHAADLLPKKPTTTGGDAILTSDLVVGCPCSTGVQDACKSDKLTCCAPEGSPPGGAGVCITTASTCGASETPTPAPTVAPAPPTETPAPQPTQVPACSANPGDACGSDAECCVGTCGQGVCFCTDPSRPEIGCPCDAGDANACGGRADLCCHGTCISPMATCDAGGGGSCAGSSQPCTSGGDCCSGNCNDSGVCYCTDPARPDIGCPCDASDSNACNGRPELCCNGTCISPMANC